MTASRRLGVGVAALVLGGGLFAHALDEAGLLPGVHEAEAVREFGAEPVLFLGCVAVAGLLGLLVARRGTTRPAALLAVVAGGQAVLFASFEVVARLAAGLDVAEVFVEPSFTTGVLVQVALGAAFVLVVLLAARRLRAPLLAAASPATPRLRTTYRAAIHLADAPTARGRAPPVLPVRPTIRRPKGHDMQTRRYLAAAVIPLLLAGVACEKDKDEEKAKQNAGKSCDGLLKPADASAALPSDLPAPAGATFYQLDTQGSTKQHFAYVQGSDIVKVRDDYKALLTTSSAEIKGTDQEDGAEAELEFEKGSIEGSVQTMPYCQGYVRLRVKYGPK